MSGADNIADEFEHAGLDVTLYYEPVIEEYMNPRADVDGLIGVMFTEHRRYDFGGGKRDEDNVPNFEIACERCGESGEDPERYLLVKYARHSGTTIASGSLGAMESECELRNNKPPDGSLYVVEPSDCRRCDGDGRIRVDPVAYFKQTHDARVVLALDVYEHGGVTMRAVEPGARGFSDPWDSGYVGYFCDTDETRKECGFEDKSDEEIKRALIAEIEDYDRYLRGEIFYYTITHPYRPDDILDDCGGFIGEQHAIEEAKTAAEFAAREIEQRAASMITRGEN